MSMRSTDLTKPSALRSSGEWHGRALAASESSATACGSGARASGGESDGCGVSPACSSIPELVVPGSIVIGVPPVEVVTTPREGECGVESGGLLTLNSRRAANVADPCSVDVPRGGVEVSLVGDGCDWLCPLGPARARSTGAEGDATPLHSSAADAGRFGGIVITSCWRAPGAASSQSSAVPAENCCMESGCRAW